MSKRILYFIVFSQFACTSVWFAVNAIMPELIAKFSVSENSMGVFTSAIQFGFIIGTLIFALWAIPDKYKATKIFMVCAFISAFLNVLLLGNFNNFYTIVGIRFLNGICLAGIYPIGIKIAADLYTKELPKVLSLLVGTLVLGTAFPHLLNYFSLENGFYVVIISTILLSITGAILIGFFIPFKQEKKVNHKFEIKRIKELFSVSKLKTSAFAYFGHMWELYALWAFIPVIYQYYNKTHNTNLNISLWSFLTIAIGFVACFIGSRLVSKYTSTIIAKNSLFLSLSCCLLFPVVYLYFPPTLFITFMLLWGMFVIIDSPQISTLVAQTAPIAYKGTAITIVNCIGFALTIISIQILSFLEGINFSPFIFIILAIGPLIGFYKLKNS